MNMEIANRLSSLRKEFGLSQEELAEKVGVSRQAISNWERGESSPDTDNLITLAGIYNKTIDEILTGSKNETKETCTKTNSKSCKKPNIFFRNFPYPIICVIIYLILGFCFNLWHPGWIIFLTIPIVGYILNRNNYSYENSDENRG